MLGYRQMLPKLEVPNVGVREIREVKTITDDIGVAEALSSRRNQMTEQCYSRCRCDTSGEERIPFQCRALCLMAPPKPAALEGGFCRWESNAKPRKGRNYLQLIMDWGLRLDIR